MRSQVDLQRAPRTSIPYPRRTPAVEPDMVWIPGGEFLMGSDRHYVEEAPAHRVRVDGFVMDRYPVTNARFRRFVEETGYVTYAELPGAVSGLGAPVDAELPGSLVFVPPIVPIDLQLPIWWRFVAGANWRHPLGPGSSIDELDDHPVVHVTSGDAMAFARWEGKSLPTEAEWEFAARGGLTDAEYAWGDELMPDGRIMANTWQGEFPWYDRAEDGYERTSPVTAFPPNGYGLYDMIGNVWEWTADWYRPYRLADARSGRVQRNPRVDRFLESYDPRSVPTHVPRKVMKGGSHLCAPNYCRRYRPAARQPEASDTSACHLGFRCIVRPTSAGPAR
jgi:formylglycine-generating enzyme required for sulfatase activity